MKKLILLVVLALTAVPVVNRAHAETARVPDDMAANSAARKACADAMNADPQFAQSIVATVDKQIDQKTIDAHLDAEKHIKKNEKHVIIAYAAMWIVAALFLAFMYWRQEALNTEILRLRKDLQDAAKDAR